MAGMENKNALRHGVFAKAIILSGEDASEFEQLHISLITEWDPEGPTEYDAVASLVKAVWRKRRYLQYRQRQFAKSDEFRSVAQEKGMKVADELAQFLESAKSGTLGEITEDELPKRLPKAWAEYFKQYQPRRKYPNDSAWLSAITDRIKIAESSARTNAINAASTEDIYSSEGQIGQELDMEERLDASIDKAIRRLAQAKALKQIIVATKPPSVTNKPLKQIASPTIQVAMGDDTTDGVSFLQNKK